MPVDDIVVDDTDLLEDTGVEQTETTEEEILDPDIVKALKIKDKNAVTVTDIDYIPETDLIGADTEETEEEEKY